MGIAFTPDAFAYLTQANVDYGPASRVASSQCFAFTCSDGKPLAIHLSVQTKFWESLLQIVDSPALAADPRFKDRSGRVLRYHELHAALAPVFATRTREDWIARFERFDVPFAPINSIREVMTDPQVQHLGTFGETVHPTEGRIVSIRSPILVDGARRDNTPPPTHGEHTQEILAELGLDTPTNSSRQ